MNEALAMAAALLGSMSIATTIVILRKLHVEKWPHGRGRVCPDPGCRCWRSAADRMTRRGKERLL